MTPRFMIIHFYPLFFIFIIKNTQFDWWSIWTNTIWTMEYQMHDVVSFTNNIDVHTVVDWLSPMNRWHMFCSLPTFWFLFLAFVVVVANMGIWHGTVADTTFICFNEWKIADVVCELRNILANFFFFPFCFHLFLIGIRLVIIILSAAARQRLAISLRRVNTLCVKREFICFLMKN